MQRAMHVAMLSAGNTGSQSSHAMCHNSWPHAAHNLTLTACQQAVSDASKLQNKESIRCEQGLALKCITWSLSSSNAGMRMRGSRGLQGSSCSWSG